jgi:hypothetical protein
MHRTPITTLVLIAFLSRSTPAAPADYFKIAVVDEETGRGVPLVELRTTNEIRYFTDSNGIAAIAEPGLMGQPVFFHIKSHGYEYPADGFGFRGTALKLTPGGSAQLKIKRLNIAERLYRVTGQGIYRDTVLLGQTPPLKNPVLNGQVTGQDTVVAIPYRGKLYWFWGDTNRPSYPLGNFSATGATSELPGKGGLDPSVGVDLNYITDDSGFTKRMVPTPEPGLKWIEGLMTVNDDQGRQRLVARYANHKDLGPATEWGLLVFNDEKQVFDRVARFDIHVGHMSSHPFRVSVDGQAYYYLQPNMRVKADLKHLADLKSYESFTPLAAGSRYNKSALKFDRAADGRLIHAWKPDTDPLHPSQEQEQIAAGRLKAEEAIFRSIDIATGRALTLHHGSVAWNEYRKRWIMIAAGSAGEIWFSEADTPTGPWAYARKIVSHDRYNFYNPTQHPFFDQDGGRLIYFEGTYTATFSDAREMTPRYEYNQIMYRLSLDDPRLALPAPVYRMNGSDELRLREGVAADNAWDRVGEVAFYAFSPAWQRKGLLPIYAARKDGHFVLQSSVPTGAGSAPLFLAATAPSDGAVELYEYRNQAGERLYSTQSDLKKDGYTRTAEPLCRVWPNPKTILTLDYKANPG